MGIDNIGTGVLIRMICGDDETEKAIISSLNKSIKKVSLIEDKLHFEFDDYTGLNIFDNGQSCCESRYMVTSDDLIEFTGAKLLDFELKDVHEDEGDAGYTHEVQFLDVKTDKGIFQVANHNEHNGYYGGFSIEASIIYLDKNGNTTESAQTI